MVDKNDIDMTGCLNDLPHKEDISRTLSPSMLVLGRNKTNCKQLNVTFRAYCEVYIGTTNTTEQRSVGVIALRPVKEQGGHYFMLLDTGKQLHTYIWTELPINKQVINRVDELATKGKQTDMTKVYPNFEWSPAIPIMDQADSEPENEEASFHSNE